jgi:hypothetical protein
MENVFTFHTTALGFLSWLIPLALSFLFFDRSGHLLISQPLFKSSMAVAGGGFAAFLLVLAFKRVKPSARFGSRLPSISGSTSQSSRHLLRCLY